MECRIHPAPSGSQVAFAGGHLYVWHSLGVLRKRYRLPRDGALCFDHHPTLTSCARALPARRCDRIEHWKRGNHHQEIHRTCWWVRTRTFRTAPFFGTSGRLRLSGYFIDWAILHWMHFRKTATVIPATQEIPLPALDLSRLTKPAIVVTAVMIGFFIGVPPAMMARAWCGGSSHTRTLEPKNLYREVDWGLLVFRRVVHHRRRRRECRNREQIAGSCPPLESAAHGSICRGGLGGWEYREQCPSRNAAEVARAGLRRSSHRVADAGDGIDPLRKPDHHRIGRKHHCRRKREARCVHQLR